MMCVKFKNIKVGQRFVQYTSLGDIHIVWVKVKFIPRTKYADKYNAVFDDGTNYSYFSPNALVTIITDEQLEKSES